MKSITFVLFLFFVSAWGQQEDFKAKKQAVYDACKKELNVHDNVAKILDEKKSPENENENCFLECAYTKFGLIKNGKVSEDGSKNLAIKKYGNDTEKVKKAEELFSKCYGVLNSSDAKEKCYLGKGIRDCFLKNEGQLNVFKQ